MFRRMSKRCDGCRFWSEMLAQSIGGGPVEAYCLSDKSPKRQTYVRGSFVCDAWQDAYGYAVDAPGIEETYHADIEAVEAELS